MLKYVHIMVVVVDGKKMREKEVELGLTCLSLNKYPASASSHSSPVEMPVIPLKSKPFFLSTLHACLRENVLVSYICE